MTESSAPKLPKQSRTPLAAPLQKLDDWLTPRGFSQFPKKVLYRTTLTGLLSLMGSIAPWEHAVALRWFGVFALFSAWNFFTLTILTSSIILYGWIKGTGLRTFLWFQMRLFLTAVLVYAALVWWNVPVAALAAGLSVDLVWGLAGALSTRNN